MAEFIWPEPTDEQLFNYCNKSDSFLDALRAAIHLARRLDAGVCGVAISQAWQAGFGHHAIPLPQWILTRGGAVQPLPPPVPTLAEALAAARLLGGEAAEVVTRYLQAQQQEGRADG